MPQPSVALLQRQCPASADRSRRRRESARAATAARVARRLHGSAASVALVVAVLFTVGAELATGQQSSLRAAVAAGSSVVAMQRALGVTADGVAGPQTIAAVRRFQQRRGLVVDGIAGPVTLAALGLRSANASFARGSGGEAAPQAVGSPAGKLRKIARCESGGNARAVSANGLYRGKYQFSRATWQRLGGRGDPARAPEAEQDRIAAKQFAQSGTSAWPSCG